MFILTATIATATIAKLGASQLESARSYVLRVGEASERG